MTFTFNNKETYLAYVVEWKAKYAEGSAKQRALKASMKEAARNGEHVWKQQRDILSWKSEAFVMLENRKLAKQEAQRLYAESKTG